MKRFISDNKYKTPGDLLCRGNFHNAAAGTVDITLVPWSSMWHKLTKSFDKILTIVKDFYTGNLTMNEYG
jgi:hypothetical protein